jgi:uncharacterized protein
MSFLQELWQYMATVAPYLVFGLLAAGVVHIFVPLSLIQKHLGGDSGKGVLKAALFGIPLPLCSCSVIPTAITLKKGGASNGATSSFLIATPESGVDSMAMTYAMMDIPMTVMRPLAAFLTATLAGFSQMLFNKEEVPQEVEEKKSCCKKNKKEAPKKSVKEVFRFAFLDMANDLSFWLTVGLVAGAAISYFIPADAFEASNGLMGRLLVLGIGIPLYICASASTPIAAALMLKGMSPGTALILLLVGPATNIANLLVLQKYIGKKGVMINIICIGVVSFALSYLVDFLYGQFSWPFDFKVAHQHEHGLAWWNIVSGIFIAVLLLKGLYQEEVVPRLKKRAQQAQGCH